MGEIWVVADHEGGALRKVTGEMLTAARGLGGEVVAVYCGAGLDAAEPGLAAHGAVRALVAEDEAFERHGRRRRSTPSRRSWQRGPPTPCSSRAPPTGRTSPRASRRARPPA